MRKRTVEISALEKLKGNISEKEKKAIDNDLRVIESSGNGSEKIDNFFAELGKTSGELNQQERQTLTKRFKKITGYTELELDGYLALGASDNYAHLTARLENAKKFNDPKMIGDAEENLKKFQSDMKNQIAERLQKSWEISNPGKPVPTVELSTAGEEKKTISQIDYLSTNLSFGNYGDDNDVFSERYQRVVKTDRNLNVAALRRTEITSSLAQRGITEESEVRMLSNAMSNIESRKILRY